MPEDYLHTTLNNSIFSQNKYAIWRKRGEKGNLMKGGEKES